VGSQRFLFFFDPWWLKEEMAVAMAHTEQLGAGHGYGAGGVSIDFPSTPVPEQLVVVCGTGGGGVQNIRG
jgi:hypothetical protein